MSTGRYAPSPTGTLHLGNLRTAVAAALFARSAGSAFLLRWDDLDDTSHPDHEATQLEHLHALGIEFDPPVLRQTERRAAYDEVLSSLETEGQVYPCFCSRREIREAVAAPHGATVAYPGTCRDLPRAALDAKRQSGRPPALRLRADAAVVTIVDRHAGEVTATVDDFVVRRGDGTPAYNLTTVIDDAAQSVEDVVRGDDLLESTPRQAHLARVLGLTEPRWTHVPLVVDEAGDRLAKRDGSTGLERWCSSGGTAASLLGAIGRSLGIDVEGDATFDELVAGFDPNGVPAAAAVAVDAGTGLSLRT